MFSSYISLPLSRSSTFGFAFGSISQPIPDAAVNQVYFVTAEVTIPSTAQACTYQVYTDMDTLLDYQYGTSAQSGPVNASGNFSGTPGNLYFQFNCFNDEPADLRDTWATLDNVALYVYDASAGPPGPPTQVLVNGDFESGSNSPWSASSSRAAFAVINGRATITFNQITSVNSNTGWFYQILSATAADGQRVRLQADVYITEPSSDTTCSVEFYFGQMTPWGMGSVQTSQNYHVDTTFVMEGAASVIYMWASCTGTDTTTNVAFDNVYLTLNAP